MATKVVQKQYRRTKARVSLRELDHMSNDQAKKRAKRARARKNEGWEDVVPAAGRWVAKEIRCALPGASLVRMNKRSAISDIYLELLTPAVLVACRKIIGKHRLVYRATKVKLEDVYKSFALDIYMRAVRELLPVKSVGKPLEVIFKKAKKQFCGSLSYKKWRFIRSTFRIPPDVARTKLSNNLRKHVNFGETIALDEKMKKWRGASPCIKKVPSKPDPIGHWFTQAACQLQNTSLPYVFGLYPFTGKDPEDGESYEGRQKIWEWLVKLMSYGGVKDFPAVFSDSFYLTAVPAPCCRRRGSSTTAACVRRGTRT